MGLILYNFTYSISSFSDSAAILELTKTFDSACVRNFSPLVFVIAPSSHMVCRHVVTCKEHPWRKAHAWCWFDLGYRMALTVSNLHRPPKFLSKYLKIYPPSTVICYTHSQLAVQPCNVRRVYLVFILLLVCEMYNFWNR